MICEPLTIIGNDKTDSRNWEADMKAPHRRFQLVAQCS
jgi:hypothetical protein